MANVIRMWTIYERPSDYPLDYVVRGSSVASGLVSMDKEPLGTAPSLELARELLPKGTVRVQSRGEDPDACIVEVWV